MIGTARLRLRPWRAADRAPFLAMSADPEVMAHLGGVADAAAVDASLARIAACQAAYGHCFWAVERRDDGAFLGFCGLKVADPGTPIAGEVEIGWRLARDAWGRGYASEAAQAALGWAWATLPVARVVAVTVPANVRSRGLMERLGMRRLPALDFAHPQFPAGHPLSRHIVHAAERRPEPVRAAPAPRPPR